jgi:polyisoprenoid-binding protein YceI
MRTTTVRLSLAVLCLAPAAAAWTHFATPLTLQPQSRLWVDGTSTVRSFTCKASVLEADVSAASANAVSAVLAGQKAVQSVEVRVPAARLDCGNGTMNEHMQKALKSAANPSITFRVNSYTVDAAGDAARGALTGTLTLGGVQKTITVSAAGRDAGDGSLRVTGVYALDMTEFGLKPPTLMMGTMKVGATVKVGFDLRLRSSAPIAAAPQPRTSVTPRPVEQPARVAAPPAVARTTRLASAERTPVRPAVRTTTVASAGVAVRPAALERVELVRPAIVPAATLVADTAPVVATTLVVQPVAAVDTTPVRDISTVRDTTPVPDSTATPSVFTMLPPITLQHVRPNDQRGINVFEAPKDDGVPYTGFKVSFGAAFTQQFQGLGHENTAAPKIAAGATVDQNQLIQVGHGFNNAVANAYVGAQLAKGIRVAMTGYLSARHHNEMWVKDGYLLIDDSPIDFMPLNVLMSFVTLKAGHFEINYGDTHFRRTDNGNAMYNPLVGNYIMDAFTTQIGSEVYLRAGGMMLMGAVTNGEVRGMTLTPQKRSPAFIAKAGIDRQVSKDLRVRLTGSTFAQARAANQTLFSGDRAGSRYYNVLENTAATESANFTSGAINPGMNEMHAVVINPFIKYRGLELYGNVERARGKAVTETARRDLNQNAIEGTFRFLNDKLYVSSRYNTVSGRLAGMTNDISVDRVQAGAGWFITPLILMKGELVSQTYNDFPTTDIRNGGRFKGFVFESTIAF